MGHGLTSSEPGPSLVVNLDQGGGAVPTFLTFALCCCHILFISLTGARAGASVWAGVANWPQSEYRDHQQPHILLHPDIVIIVTTVENPFIMATMHLFIYHQHHYENSGTVS